MRAKESRIAPVPGPEPAGSGNPPPGGISPWTAWVCVWLSIFGTPIFAQDAAVAPVKAAEIADNAMILVGAPEGAPREGAALDRITHEVASRMRCPVCQGLSVEDSHTDTARAMKAEAHALLAAGFSPEQTLRYFEASYGEFIRLAPKAEGFNLVVWIAPGAILLLGAAIVAFRLRGKGPVPASAEGPPREEEEDPELAGYLERVREEVGVASREETT